tara:strand:- start:20 stop:961 length:942 start_codon:yes stop_codon:yes gene_type:complete
MIIDKNNFTYLLVVVVVVIGVIAILVVVKRHNDALVEFRNNQEVQLVDRVSYRAIPQEPNLETRCFSTPGTQTQLGDIGDLSAQAAWIMDLVNDGATVESVDLSGLPITNNTSVINLQTTSFGALVNHRDDIAPYPETGSARNLKLEDPLAVNGVSIPDRGFQIPTGSRLNGHSIEFVFDDPVGIFSADLLNFNASVDAPGKIQLWDENNTLIYLDDESIVMTVAGDVMFIGIQDPRNRIKTLRITTGQDMPLTQADTWGIAYMNFGINDPNTSITCDVERIATYENGILTLTYIDQNTMLEITDKDIIDSLI